MLWIVCVLYVLSYLDRGNIGNAKTAGAQDDLGLNSAQVCLIGPHKVPPVTDTISGLGFSMVSTFATLCSSGEQYYGRYSLRTFTCQLSVSGMLRLIHGFVFTEFSIAGV